MPFSIAGANAQHRLGVALKDSARNPGQMAKALCGRIKPDDGTLTLNLAYLDEEETACVQSMKPEAWRALRDFASASGGAGLQSVVLGSGMTIDESTVRGLAELSEMVMLTLQPGPPVAEGLLLRLRRFNAVQITQLHDPAEVASAKPSGLKAQHPGAAERLPSRFDDDEPTVSELAVVARDVMVEALRRQDAHDASELSTVVNFLLEEAPEIPPGHVDKLLLGFLRSAIESGRGDLVDCYTRVIFNSPALRQDPGRRFGLLMGLTLPTALSDWKPDSAAHVSDPFPIANAAAARLAGTDRGAPAYRGPPLLNRLCRDIPVRKRRAPVSPQQVALYHGVCALFIAVVESKELTTQEKKTFCASSFAGAGGMRTAAQFAMQRGNVGMVVAMMEITIHADLPVEEKAELFGILGVDVPDLIAELRALTNGPTQTWVNDVLSWMEPAYAVQQLMRGDAQVELLTDDPQLSALCAAAGLRAVQGRLDPEGDAHEMDCRATQPIPGLKEIRRPQEAGADSPDAFWYAIPLSKLRRRQ